MRTLLVLMTVTILAPMAVAKVWTTVYRCDETTPLALVDPNRTGVYRDIMVGTRLVIVVSSDTGEYWGGQLRLSWDDAAYATLSGRGPVVVPGVAIPEYVDSCLVAAGGGAAARVYEDGARGVGLEFLTSAYPPVFPGDWFIFDYRAEGVGTCEVGLYDPFASLDVPIETLSFTHVPSRDFDGDTIVNFEDLALLAGRWRTTADDDRNRPEVAFDLNSDSRIDADDLALFSEYWLERTDCNDMVADPNDSSPGV